MSKTPQHAHAMSRHWQTALMVACLTGTALLIALDRRVLTPRRNRRAAADQQTAGQDAVRYHGKAFVTVRVFDGDTLDIDAPDGDASTTRIRLLGIDAPETRGEGGAPAFFAVEAATLARQLVDDDPVTVYLDRDGPSRGKYGRLLAYIELADGRFLNEVLLSEGHVYADLRFRHGTYQKYRQLESSARALGKGLWKEATPQQWPAWRRRMVGD